MKYLIFFKIISFIGLLSSWSKKALEDGVVTMSEASELVEGICSILGVRTEFNFAMPEVLAQVLDDDDLPPGHKHTDPHLKPPVTIAPEPDPEDSDRPDAHKKPDTMEE